MANASLSPASGGILATATRINFQPSTTVIPEGFFADTGKPVAVRTNGKTYGWSTDTTANAVARNGAVPLVEYDTFVPVQTAAGSNTWSITLPNGSYPVIVVAGDALSTDQTNNLIIAGQAVTDATPATTSPGYEAGNFDGFAVQASVTNGTLTIAAGSGAVRAKLCFVEIGALGATLSQADRDRLAAMVAKANAQTGANPDPVATTREFAYGGYVDEVVAYRQTVGATINTYYPHYNHLYSVAALTNAAGQVVERYTYDAYGKQTMKSAAGASLAKSSVGWDRGFTGYVADNETGLTYARERMYSVSSGSYLSRDFATDLMVNGVFYPSGGMGYQDGMTLYRAWMVPNLLDPNGLITTDDPSSDGDYFDESIETFSKLFKNPDLWKNFKNNLDKLKGKGKLKTHYISSSDTASEFAENAKNNGDCTINIYFGHGYAAPPAPGAPPPEPGQELPDPGGLKKFKDALGTSPSTPCRSGKVGFYGCFGSEYTDQLSPKRTIPGAQKPKGPQIPGALANDFGRDMEATMKVIDSMHSCCPTITIHVYFGEMGMDTGLPVPRKGKYQP